MPGELCPHSLSYLSVKATDKGWHKERLPCPEGQGTPSPRVVHGVKRMWQSSPLDVAAGDEGLCSLSQ